jgi:hypothetical protein
MSTAGFESSGPVFARFSGTRPNRPIKLDIAEGRVVNSDMTEHLKALYAASDDVIAHCLILRKLCEKLSIMNRRISHVPRPCPNKQEYNGWGEGDAKA